MAQNLQDTDAYILREFAQVCPRIKRMLTPAARRAGLEHYVPPFHVRLMANGHSRYDAAALLRAVYDEARAGD